MGSANRNATRPELSADERKLLRNGLLQWGGPARMSDAVARAIGFESEADFDTRRSRLLSSVDRGLDLAPEDWTRVLLATEVVFASDTVGAGIEWQTVTGLDDVESIRLLRSVQRKVARVRLPGGGG